MLCRGRIHNTRRDLHFSKLEIHDNTQTRKSAARPGKPVHTVVKMAWIEIPRNSILRKEDILTFFSEFDSAKQLSDEEAVRRGAFLVRHMPPKDYRQLKVKRKFADLAKRLNSVIPVLWGISDSMC